MKGHRENQLRAQVRSRAGHALDVTTQGNPESWLTFDLSLCSGLQKPHCASSHQHRPTWTEAQGLVHSHQTQVASQSQKQEASQHTKEGQPVSMCLSPQPLTTLSCSVHDKSMASGGKTGCGSEGQVTSVWVKVSEKGECSCPRLVDRWQRPPCGRSHLPTSRGHLCPSQVLRQVHPLHAACPDAHSSSGDRHGGHPARQGASPRRMLGEALGSIWRELSPVKWTEDWMEGEQVGESRRSVSALRLDEVWS